MASTDRRTSVIVHIPVERIRGFLVLARYFKKGILTASSDPILKTSDPNSVSMSTSIGWDGVENESNPLDSAYLNTCLWRFLLISYFLKSSYCEVTPVFSISKRALWVVMVSAR